MEFQTLMRRNRFITFIKNAFLRSRPGLSDIDVLESVRKA